MTTQLEQTQSQEQANAVQTSEVSEASEVSLAATKKMRANSTELPTKEPIPALRTCSCTACGSTELTDFFEIERLPIHVGVLWDSPEQAHRAATGDIILSYCHECGFVHNRILEQSKLSFQPGYEVALHHSAVFRSFMEAVATRLIERFGLRNKAVFEIGCGTGYFLQLLSELGPNEGIGIDPTVAHEGTEKVGEGTVRLIRDFFSERYADLHFDFICCLSVFEDIPQPIDFLSKLRNMIGDRQTPIYFEVFNAFRAFQKQETWSIHYEQCNYFSLRSLRNLFERCGFQVLDANTCYEGDQYLYIEAVPGNQPTFWGNHTARLCRELPDEIAEFAATHRRQLASWTERLAQFKQRGQRVVVWGTGGKGISFLNALGTSDLIQYVVEINPDKQGKYVPGSAQLIVPPEFLTEYQPDKVIITNPLYKQEMEQQAKDLGVSCEFLIA